MIFHKLLCIPPNLEIFLTGVYTIWCLCSREILSWHHLLDKINVCWSTMNGSEENAFITILKYSVSSLHLLQFILAYIMLAAGILTVYPILFNKSASLLNPIIIASEVRQIYSNSVAVVLGALLCYGSGSNFDEFQCFFGRFLVNMTVSYYIIFSYKDFQSYVRRRSSPMAVPGPTTTRNFTASKPAIRETKSENSFITDRNCGTGRKVSVYQQNDDGRVSRMSSIASSKRTKTLPSETDAKEDIHSIPSASSMPTTATTNSKDIFFINFINHKTKAKLLSFKIEKQN